MEKNDRTAASIYGKLSRTYRDIDMRQNNESHLPNRQTGTGDTGYQAMHVLQVYTKHHVHLER